MNQLTIVTPETEEDAKPYSSSQHEYNFFLDGEIQRRLLASGDVDHVPSTTSAPTGVCPWMAGPSVRRTSSATGAASSATAVPSTVTHHRTREPRVNKATRRDAVNRSKDIPFRFHHHADIERYMDEYRRTYTYANLDTSKVVDGLVSDGPSPIADHKPMQTSHRPTGRTNPYASKRHPAPSNDFQDQRLDAVMDSVCLDRFSRSTRNLGDVEWQTSGPLSTNKFWTFDVSDILPMVVIDVARTGRGPRSIGATAAAGGLTAASSAAVFAGKEARHFPANGYAIDDQSTKRTSSGVSNIQLPIAGLRALDILRHTSHARIAQYEAAQIRHSVARLTQQRPLGVSTTLPVLR